MIHGHPPQPQQQQQQAHPHMAHPPPPPAAHQVPPPHLAHLTSVPPPNVPQPGTMPQQQQQQPPPPPQQTREHHSGPRINNRHHHHPRVPAGGGGDHHHQSMPGPHMPLQGSRKPPSQHYGTSNGMAHGMGSKHQHSGMGHPPKTLPYSSSHQHQQQQQQQQHHHQQHNHHSHHNQGHHNSAAIPVVSAAGPGASKARMIPSHEPKIIHNHSNTAPVSNNNNNNSSNNPNAIVVHQADPIQQQLSGGISSSTATTTPGSTNMSSNTAGAPSSGSVPAVMGGSGGGGGGGGGGSGGVIQAAPTATTVVVMGNASDSNQKDPTTIIHTQSILLSSVPETLANTKEKTPMCLVNELARYNKIQHQYRLTGESGPAHKKRFTVTLKLGDEEYTAEGPSIKKAQHSAAHEAIGATKYKHPPAKTNRTKTGGKTSIGNITPTVELNALAMKRGEPTVYETEQVVTAPKYPVNSHPPGGPNAAQQGGAGSHNFFSAPPPGAHYGGYHRSNSMYNAPPPAGVRYGAPVPPNSFNRRNTMGGKPDYHSRGYYYNQHVPPMAQPVPEVYKVTLHVGERTFLGEGHTLQAARHDAAARALEVLKPLTPDSANAVTDSHNTSIDSDDPNSELKSPISLVHEMALKRKLSVQFEVHGEKGPPHMKVFTTLCKVGTIVTEGEGNGKKLSKKRAAEKMLDELRKLPPASPEKNTRMLLKQKRKVPLPKKKTRNLIKEKGDEDPSGMVNPISRLMQIQQARKEKEPVYTLLEERGVARRREFIMEVSASGKSATGVGSTKKLAKKEAAENLLVMLGYGRSVDGGGSDGSPNKENLSGSANEMMEKPPPGRKILFSEGGSAAGGGGKGQYQGGGGGSSGRQIVPGVLHLNSGISNKPASGTSAKEPSQESNVSVESSTSSAITSAPKPSTAAVNASSTSNVAPSTTPSATPAATTTTASNPDVGRMKEQLMYLAQLLKFDVMFSDFPKGNHGEYLTLVTLSTEPPQLCHGSGASLEQSHDEAARGALEILSKIGLDNVKPKGSTVSAGADESDDSSYAIKPHYDKGKVSKFEDLLTKASFEWFSNFVAKNDEQMAAVRNIVNRTAFPAPYVLFGPPGTGKTSTIVEAVLQIWKLQPTANVLVSAPSNFACEEFTKRLLEFIPATDVFRFLSKSSEKNILNIDQAVIDISNFSSGTYAIPSWHDVYNSRIVVATTTMCGRLAQAKIDPHHFKYIFIDEAGSNKEVSALVPIAGIGAIGKEVTASVVLSGDPKQLGPLVTHKFLYGTVQEVSMLERLMNHAVYIKDPNTTEYNPLVITKLLDNFRSNKFIIEFSSCNFYGGVLRPRGPPFATDWVVGWSELPRKKCPFFFHSVRGKTEKDAHSSSLYNRQEADQIVSYIKTILSGPINGRSVGQADIGVISPYAKQVHHIKTLCKDNNWDQVEVGSVEQFQGREKPIILISTVRSEMTSVGFLNNEKRLNVAMTRARALMIIVGNPDTLQRDVTLYSMLRYCVDYGAFTGSEFKLVPPYKQVKDGDTEEDW